MFFQKTGLGIDISDYSIEIVSLGGTAVQPRLLAMARKVLDKGIFISGSILDKNELKKNLKKAIGNLKFGRLDTKKAVCAVPESKTYIRILEMPENMNKKDVLEYVKSEIQESFPHSLDDLYFDFNIENNKILLAACPKFIVQDYLEVFQDCDLDLTCLEIESLSLARALLPSSKENVLIADIGARTTNFSLFSAGKLKFSFSLVQAGHNFTLALSEKLGISLSSAENLKKEIGLNADYEEGKVFLILQKEIQPIVEEVKKIRNYFFERTGSSVEKIIIAGGSASLIGISDYLAQNLALPVEIGDPWVKIDIGILKKREYLKDAMEVNPVLYSSVIGSALRSLGKDSGINLLKGRFY